MTKLTGAALDRAVANAMGLKSVHNCEKWGEHMNRIEEDDDTQVYKKPWVGLTFEEKQHALYLSDWKTTYMEAVIEYIEQTLKDKNA
jgi:hypothetical protein